MVCNQFEDLGRVSGSLMSQVPSLQTGWCWHLPSGLLRELNKANRAPPTELEPQGPVSVRYLYPLRSSLFSLLATLVSHSLFLACFLLNNSTKSFFSLLRKSFTKDKEDHWSKAGTSEAHSFTQVWASTAQTVPVLARDSQGEISASFGITYMGTQGLFCSQVLNQFSYYSIHLDHRAYSFNSSTLSLKFLLIL